MRVAKGETETFDDYVVFKHKRRWAILDRVLGPKSIRCPQAVEADEEIGLLVEQVVTSKGEVVYTNGRQEVFIDNTIRLLLLVPGIRGEFHAAGFRPKLTTSYVQGLRIVHRNGKVLNATELSPNT